MPINEQNGSRYRCDPSILVGEVIAGCGNDGKEWHLFNQHGKRILIIQRDGSCFDGDGMLFTDEIEFLGAG